MSEELNKKLAEWAGFEHKVVDIAGGEAQVDHWYYGTQSFIFFPPNFTDSLNACFKWLVPKLKRWELGSNAEGSSYAIVSDRIQKYPSEAQAKTPALALCLAISKLIEQNEHSLGTPTTNTNSTTSKAPS